MTRITRRRLTGMLALSTVSPMLAFGQGNSTVKIIAPFPAGGGTDMIARALAEQLRGVVAPNVVVDNKPGAGGRLAVNDVKMAPPDGQLLMVNTSGLLTIYPHTVKQLNYEPTDVAVVSLVNKVEFAWAVGPMVPSSVSSMKEYISWVKTNPTQDTFASPANASPTEFLGLLLGRAAGVDLRPVNYKGSAPAVLDTIGGQVAAISSPLSDLMPHLKGGKLRILATSGTERSAYTPEVATYAEQGFPQLTNEEWYAVYVRGNTPIEVQRRLSAQIRKALTAKPLIELFATFAMDPVGSTPEEAAALAKSGLQRWSTPVKELGIQAE